MKFIRCIIVLFSLTINTAVLADKSWMDMSITDLFSFFGCITPPEYTNFNQGNTVLRLKDSGVWVSAGTNVQADKSIKFSWGTLGVESQPRKYLVLYRIDPRFQRPQVFIQEYDYNQQRFVSDFHKYKQGQLLRYQSNPDMVFSQRINDYSSYFQFVDRKKIPVNNGDVVNITLKGLQEFFTYNTDFANELNGASDPRLISTVVPGDSSNKILYATATSWCDFLKAKGQSLYTAGCSNNKYSSADSVRTLTGNPMETAVAFAQDTPSCTEGLNTKNLSQFCIYGKGRGMQITLNGESIKNTQDSFVHSDFRNIDFFYYKSSATGDLDFITDWDIGPGMFTNLGQFVNDWKNINDSLELYIYRGDLSMNYLHIGRYIMTIEVGDGTNAASVEQLSDIRVEYAISDSMPASGVSGISVPQDGRVSASSAGNLWFRVINPHSNIQGTITVNYANYTGSTWVSNMLYNNMIAPLRSEFNKLTKRFYDKLVGDYTLQKIAKTMLTLYIMLYSLFFLAGATQITVSDLVERVLKISIIVLLFSKTSWDFFSNNLFDAYVSGSDYLMSSVAGSSSNNANIFGFIDPIFDKYTNPKIWGLLFIQLLQIDTGLTFFAIMTVYSLVLFFKAVLQVIIGYCLAFLSLAVLISLAPFFIILMLFSQTKSLFDNWLSSLFRYMIQPTILLIFFLIIDQMVSSQILLTLTKVCWKPWIPIVYGLDLRVFHIPINFSFPLPFLPYISFFVPEVADIDSIPSIFNNPQGTFITVITSSLLFYSFCLMAHGLVEYLDGVISTLTGVSTSSSKNNDSTFAGAVMGDLGKGASVLKKAGSIAAKPLGVFKDKVIDQNYTARRTSESNNMKKIKDGSRHDV